MLFQTTQISRRILWLAAVPILLGTGAALLHAFNPQPDPPKVFGIFGITPVDVIRLHVTNVAGEVGTAAEPCSARIGFVNGDGALLKAENVAIPAGHSASINLSFSEATPPGTAASPVHVNVRPVFGVLPPGPCFTAVSAEIADGVTGRTNIYALPQLFAPGPPTVPVNGQ